MKTQTKKISGYLALALFSLFNIQLAQADEAAGEKKAAACVSCHGAKGISNNAQYPNLAGQQAAYIAAQLKAFKKGTRVNSTMQGIVANLSDDDIENLADFFASLPNDSVGNGKASGEAKAKFAMCAGCHGSKGEGRGNFPKISNQHAEYIVKQLQAFADETHKNSPMNAVAKGLSKEDMQALADYLSTVK